MPKVSEASQVLKPFAFHGVILAESAASDQATAECPFCSKAKFFVNTRSGLWDCKSCARKGNPLTFLRELWAESDKATKDYGPLARDRGLLRPDTLMRWGFARSITTGEWIVPGYDHEGKITTLYRYAKAGGPKKILLATPDFPHGWFGPGVPSPDADTVYVTEGPWDGMTLWETLAGVKETGEGGHAATGNEAASLLATRAVISTPGSNVWGDRWGEVVQGREVAILFDNDHPREIEGRVVTGAGWAGSRRVAEKLARCETPPSSIYVLQWGESDEHGHDSSLPSGYDLRDLLRRNDAKDAMSRAANWSTADDHLLVPMPEGWVGGRTTGAVKTGSPTIEPVPCSDWRTLINSWRKAMKWSPSGEGLDHGLACMLAACVSTRAVGDQLWMKIIGPPSCGKSTLCEAISVSKKYVLAKSTIRGFHSGFQTDRGGEEDHSLLALAKDKTLVTKDGDTLLQAPNLSQILSEARDVYDRVSRTHYRNATSRDYEGLSMTWLLCGTSSLRTIDDSELGARFLDCVIMDEIDDETEDAILARVAEKVTRGMVLEVDGAVETSHDPEMLAAMRLTGGYVEYLRENARSLFAGVSVPQKAKAACVQLGKFVAHIRARPSSRQDENAEREFSARLVGQLLRLATCLAVVLNRTEIDDEVIARARRVALDTARGRTYEIAKLLHEKGRAEGCSVPGISVRTSRTDADTRKFLRFLKMIGVTEPFQHLPEGSKSTVTHWRLTERFSPIYAGVDRGYGDD